jgi:hypothetical protein
MAPCLDELFLAMGTAGVLTWEKTETMLADGGAVEGGSAPSCDSCGLFPDFDRLAVPLIPEDGEIVASVRRE